MVGKFDDRIFRILIENGNEGVAIIGAEGEVIYISPAVEKILGYSEEEIDKNNSFQFVHPDHIKTARKTFLNFVSGAVGFQSVEIRMSHKDGYYIWVEANVTNMLNNPEIQGIVVNFRDINEKKQTEEKLKFHSMVLDQIQDLVTVTDLKGVIQYVNRVQLKSFGLSKEAMIGKSVHVFGENSKKGPTQDEIIEKTLKNGSWTGEVNNFSKDGKELVIQTKTQIVKDETGKPIAMVGISSDITEKKKAEKELRESEEKFKGLFHEHAAVKFIIDPVTGDIVEANNAASKFYGWSVAELKKMKIQDINLLSEKEVKEEMEKSRYLKKNHFEFKHVKADGSVCDVEVFSNGVKIEGKEYLYSVIHDTTEKKKIEIDLAKSEKKFRQIYSNIQTGIARVTLDFTITNANDAYCKMLGYSEKELIGKHLKDITHPEVLEENLKKQTELGKGIVDAYFMEKKFIHKDGHTVYGILNANLIRDEEGNPDYFIGSIVDITDRKKVENDLKNRNSHFRTLVNTIPDLIWLKDADGFYLSCNESFERLFGACEEDIVGKTDYDFVDKELADFFRENDRKAMAVGGPHINEELVTFADGGHEAFLETIKSPMFDADGKLTGILGIGRDITDRKKAEEELKDRERRLQQIFNILPIGLWFADETGKLIMGNPAGVKIWGAEPKVGLEEYGVFKARKLPENKEITGEDWALAKTIRYGVIIENELLEIDAFDGKKKVILNYTAPVTDDEDNIKGAIVINQEITEKYKAEENLKESEEKYRRITDNMIDVVWTSDLDANLTFITPSIEKLTGESVEENMKKSITERFTPESLVKILPMFQEELEKEKDPNCNRNRSRLIEADQLRKDGSVINVAMNISFLRDDSGNPTGFIGITRDVTAQKKAELEKEELTQQLVQSQKMESIGRLAGGVAHDFNNMLSVILGRSEIALGKTDQGSKLFNELTEIKIAAERSADLTAQLLAFARKQVISPKITSVNDEIKKIAGMLKRLIGEDIVLICNSSRTLKNISIDPAQLSQILTNLCINAKDADAETITITTDICRKKGFSDEYIEIKISDDGSGMNEETRSKIFEPFFTTKQLGKGTGLGLSTIYGIVKQNNGSIHVESEVGKGTAFTISFPVVDIKRRKEKVESGKRETVPSGQTILIVEDEESILNMTSLMLEDFGYKVIAASTPGEAVNLAVENSGNIDLVLTDVVMPEMNGRDLVKKIMNYYPDIKSVFMSGYTADVIASKGILDEDMDFLHKPFSMSKLKEKIEQVLMR